MIKIHDKVFKPFISHDRILEAISGVAERVNADFRDCEDVPIVL